MAYSTWCSRPYHEAPCFHIRILLIAENPCRDASLSSSSPLTRSPPKSRLMPKMNKRKKKKKNANKPWEIDLMSYNQPTKPSVTERTRGEKREREEKWSKLKTDTKRPTPLRPSPGHRARRRVIDMATCWNVFSIYGDFGILFFSFIMWRLRHIFPPKKYLFTFHTFLFFYFPSQIAKIRQKIIST